VHREGEFHPGEDDVITETYAIKNFWHYVTCDYGGKREQRHVDPRIVKQGWRPIVDGLMPLIKAGCTKLLFANPGGYKDPGSYELDAMQQSESQHITSLSSLAQHVRRLPADVFTAVYLGHMNHPQFAGDEARAFQYAMSCIDPYLDQFKVVFFDSAVAYAPESWRFGVVQATRFMQKKRDAARDVGVETGSFVKNRRYWMPCYQYDDWEYLQTLKDRLDPIDRPAGMSGPYLAGVKVHWDKPKSDFLERCEEPLSRGYQVVAQLDRLLKPA
jgi:hypothetical protein